MSFSIGMIAMMAAMTLSADGTAGQVIPLWEGQAPEAQGAGEDNNPTIKCFYPPKDKATGAAVVICPGGGYSGLAFDYEGEDVARWLNEEGIAGFVLRYRHAPAYKHPVPLNDAKRAVRYVRAHAAEWGIDPVRIGMLGFSAGGHLTASAGTLFDDGDRKAKDPVDRLSSRPDFLILIYPVITMSGKVMHAGSRTNLLGEKPPKKLADRMSPEKQVTQKTPPAFLVHSAQDTAVPVENSILFYRALRNEGIPAEMHLFERGQHGYGLAQKDPVLSVWPKLCIGWLHEIGVLK
jgi:acetyl esterase/lipase